MNMATDATAAASSVQNEYNVRSKTSENAFLTSPEGQDWGAKAVEKAVGFVTTLADGIVMVAGVFSGLSETLGGVGLALAGVGVAAAALTGPFGIALAAGMAMGAGIVGAAMRARDALLGIVNDPEANALYFPPGARRDGGAAGRG